MSRLFYKFFTIVYFGGADMWYAKMYFSGKKEVFQFDSHGIKGVPSTYKELPFLESLLSFWSWTAGNWLRRSAGSQSTGRI